MRNCMIGMLLLLSCYVRGQSRLGYSATEIMSEFSTKDWHKGVSDQGIPYIYFVDSKVSCSYMLNVDQVCVVTVVAPLTQGALQYFVEMYNKQFVIINDRRWKWYTDSGNVVNINLTKIDESMVFIFKYAYEE